MAEGSRSGEKPDPAMTTCQQLTHLPGERNRDPRPTAHPSCSAFVGCWHPEGLFFHPVNAAAAAGSAHSRDRGGAHGQSCHRFALCSSSSFTSRPLIDHHREVTPTISTYCSHLITILLKALKPPELLHLFMIFFNSANLPQR